MGPSPAPDRISVARAAVLEVIFGGNPHAWLEYLETEGSEAQRRDDLPFVRELIRQRCTVRKES